MSVDLCSWCYLLLLFCVLCFLVSGFHVFVSCLAVSFVSWFPCPSRVSWSFKCLKFFLFLPLSVVFVSLHISPLCSSPACRYTWSPPSPLSSPVPCLVISVCFKSLHSLLSLSGHCLSVCMSLCCLFVSAWIHVHAHVPQVSLVCVFGFLHFALGLNLGFVLFICTSLFCQFCCYFALLSLLLCFLGLWTSLVSCSLDFVFSFK